MTHMLLKKIVESKCDTSEFAIIHRPHLTGPDMLEVISGDIYHPSLIKSIPLPDENATDSNYSPESVLVLIPFRQLSERGFSYVKDDSPLIAMMITDYEIVSVAAALNVLPDSSVEISNGGFDISDAEYSDIIKRVIANEIGYGAGSNFVIKRLFAAEIMNYSIQTAFSIFRHLLQNESGAYWTFLIHTGGHTFVGASPELHANLKEGIATMNPISGTYHYPPSGPTLGGIMNFLATQKEADELYMVVEEELKMIARFCPQGGRVTGPFLKEMSRLAHTEYYIKGKTQCDPREILHQTLFAPTVTGSPLENACRVIAKYEPQGRGYYGGVAALMGRDSSGSYTLDSTILIRTADISTSGAVRIGIGATIVRHSDPNSEVTETWAKVRALLDAMQHHED